MGGTKRKSIDDLLKRWRKATREKRKKVIVKAPGRTPVKKGSDQ